MIELPTPPALPTSALPEDVAAFDRQCTLHDFALRAIAIQQADEAKTHRDRMAAATEANGAALRAVADKTDSLAEQKRAAVIQLLSTQARGNRKPETFVADVRAQVDAVFSALSASGAA